MILTKKVHMVLCAACVLVCVRESVSVLLCVTHRVAAGAGRDNDSEVCRSGIGRGLVS